MENKILVIDDERPIVEILKINLEKNGYKVLCAFDGETAVEKAFSDEPDLILLDVMLPKMDGFTFFNKMKEKFVPMQGKTVCYYLFSKGGFSNEVIDLAETESLHLISLDEIVSE